MAVERVTWVSWREAWSRMPEIWEGWGWWWNSERRRNAFVNVLRLRSVNCRGEARELVSGWPQEPPLEIEVRLGRRPSPTPLDHVVVHLLTVKFDSIDARAEYQRERWSTPFPVPFGPFGRTPFQIQSAPQRLVETAEVDVGRAELAWEEFCDALRRYELPDGAFDRVGSGEGDQDQKRRRAAYRGALSTWMAPQALNSLRKEKPEDIATRFKDHCKKHDPNLLPLLPERPRSMAGPIQRIIEQRVSQVRAAARKRTVSKKPVTTNKGH